MGVERIKTVGEEFDLPPLHEAVSMEEGEAALKTAPSHLVITKS